MTATKRIVPTVVPKTLAETSAATGEAKGSPDWDPSGDTSTSDEEIIEDTQEPSLPPIAHIKPPAMQHTSTKIRWYLGLGYTVKEVSSFLGVRYQQVRNVGITAPKRAAREDVPPYIIEVWEVDDDLEAMEAHALEQQMAAQREEDRKAGAAARRRGLQRKDLERLDGSDDIAD